ncbi:MAG TPA: serine hydrolase domain-containing protein [Solirubrobacteraceae bacterium]|nr:serine hydrolase domain-containing protein [Solirubrobacteraceae bacterium]
MHTAILDATRKIGVSRLPHRRAVGSVVMSAIGAFIVVALLMPGGHGATRSTGRARGSSMPVLVAPSPQRTCAQRSGPAGISTTRSSTHAQSALDSALTATLRTARDRIHAPAVTAAVVVCGRPVWADATGVLDLRSTRPATNNSLFILNSAAKTVVATMVMQEIQDGHLSLGTRLSQFYPWLPNARQITVRMLLNMTSGLPDYLYNPQIEWMMNHRPRHRWTVDQVLTGLGTGLGTPKFSPGREFQYSDTNYIVLGGILERVTHSTIERDFQQLIARPLGITTATFVPTPAAKARIAHPYVLYRDGTLHSKWIPGFGVSSAVWGPVFTDGGLAASSLDLARFGNALLGDRLVGATAVRQMTHIGPGDYGFGIRSRSFDGHLWLGHRGYFSGFEVEYWSDPARQLTIAVATNLQVNGGEPTSTQIWGAIARTYDRRNLGTGHLAPH